LLMGRQRITSDFLTSPVQRTKLLTKSSDNFSPHIQSMVDRRVVESETCPLKMALVNCLTKRCLHDSKLIEPAGNLIGILKQYICTHHVYAQKDFRLLSLI